MRKRRFKRSLHFHNNKVCLFASEYKFFIAKNRTCANRYYRNLSSAEKRVLDEIHKAINKVSENIFYGTEKANSSFKGLLNDNTK